jgi:serine/threonine protein phosphatase PrpC
MNPAQEEVHAMTESADTKEFYRLSPLLEDKDLQILSSVVQARFAALSHTGKVRQVNEDHYLITRLGRSQETLLTNLPEGDVPPRFAEWGYGMVVADGMGGAARGEVASSLAISTLMQLMLHFGKWNLRINERVAQEVIKRAERFYQSVDEAVAKEGREDPSRAGMGTTLTATYSAGRDLFVANVGDSRAYLFRNNHLLQVTRDQTYSQMLADIGQISQRDVSTHPLRHILTQAIGTGTAKVQLNHLPLRDGDCLLLCTDGLTEMVADEEIAAVLMREEQPDEACKTLVDLALEHGGKDNVTVVIGKYEIPE